MHLANENAPISIIEEGSIIWVNEEHELKRKFWIINNGDSLDSMNSKFVQFSNALDSIWVTDDGVEIFFNDRNN